ncbi:MAG: hypothetical protein UX75_C0027G0003 [Candidatus Moranbacteria bacterium GW2011_GWE2_47_10]|nr:MAG: hypothetical protein UX75_C0027G0003 [Candidatus Moranbacteria bacterium GW2011_GWE2_47_10]
MKKLIGMLFVALFTLALLGGTVSAGQNDILFDNQTSIKNAVANLMESKIHWRMLDGSNNPVKMVIYFHDVRPQDNNSAREHRVAGYFECTIGELKTARSGIPYVVREAKGRVHFAIGYREYLKDAIVNNGFSQVKVTKGQTGGLVPQFRYAFAIGIDNPREEKDFMAAIKKNSSLK